ncbi:Uncharacterised protein [uncultured archaeon]|nr:Uncharacterised protein [uncultured archaeon]
MNLVKISPTVTAAQRYDPRFTKLLKQSEAFFNCRKPCCFGEKFRAMLCLHEGAHAYFARKAGATNIVFHGPEMFWDSRPEYNRPAISKSSVSWDEPVGGFTGETAKADLAGFICRREMTDSPNDEIAISSDIATCRGRFDRYIGTGDEAFKKLLKDVEAALLVDLKSPSIRAEIWAEAKRFEKQIFPAPKLTSDMLRAKRLGWMP